MIKENTNMTGSCKASYLSNDSITNHSGFELDRSLELDSMVSRELPSSNTPTSESHEMQKEKAADEITKMLLDTYTPKDRMHVFDMVRENLIMQLRSEVHDKAVETEQQMEAFEFLKKVIY